MEKTLMDLLERLERVYPKSIKYSELSKEFPNDLLDQARGDLISYDKEAQDNDPQFESYFKLFIRGFELLNQVRIRKSIDRFNKTSSILSVVIVILTVVIVLIALGIIKPLQVQI